MVHKVYNKYLNVFQVVHKRNIMMLIISFVKHVLIVRNVQVLNLEIHILTIVLGVLMDFISKKYLQI